MLKKRFINKKKSIPCKNADALAESLQFVEETLDELGVSKKLSMRTVLLAEEIIPQFIHNAETGADLRIHIQRSLGDASVSIQASGRNFDPLDVPGEKAELLGQMEDAEAEQAIRSILLKSQGDNLKITHRGGKNHARILVGKSDRSMMLWTGIALILGLFFGFVISSVFPPELSEGLSTCVLKPVKTVFMNALNMVIGPVVFFSIACCISQFKNLAELGRIAVKILVCYTVTTVIAVFLSILLFPVTDPGQFGFALTLDSGTEKVSVDTNRDTSILSMIVNIVPSNFVKPFLESDTLQIIFLGLLCGIAAGMIGKYAPMLQDFLEACNSLFLTITTIITRFIPLAAFCSSTLMMANIGGESIIYVLGFAGTTLMILACMLVIYGLLILVLGRLNPLKFYYNNREGMLTSLTLSSSSAAMPVNIKTCTEKMGISPKISNFSIPLGATINMDGTSIVLVTSTLFLTKAYGVVIPESMYMSIVIMIILMSLGCPGVPGAALVCLGIILEGLGVPIEAIGLIMGILPIVDMCATMSNTTGDVAMSLIVARSEGLLDLKKFKE